MDVEDRPARAATLCSLPQIVSDSETVMSQVTVTLPDGSGRSVAAGTPGARRRGRDIAAPRVGGAGCVRR